MESVAFLALGPVGAGGICMCAEVSVAAGHTGRFVVGFLALAARSAGAAVDALLGGSAAASVAAGAVPGAVVAALVLGLGSEEGLIAREFAEVALVRGGGDGCHCEG